MCVIGTLLSGDASDSSPISTAVRLLGRREGLEMGWLGRAAQVQHTYAAQVQHASDAAKVQHASDAAQG